MNNRGPHRRRKPRGYLLASVMVLVAGIGQSTAQVHFMSSIDRSVAAVGESILLTVELLAGPETEAEGVMLRHAFSDVGLDLTGSDIEITRPLRPRMTESIVDQKTILHFTRKFVLKARRPGRLEIPAIRLSLGDKIEEAGRHELMVYSPTVPFRFAQRAILPLTVQSDIGDDGLRRFIGYGSSFLVSDDALVTAHHVVVNARVIHVTLPNGRRLSLKKVWSVDPMRDIAVLKIDPDEVKKAGLVPLQIEPRDFRTSRRGFASDPEIVFTAGWPAGVQRTEAGVLFAVNQYYDDEAIWLSSNYVRPGDSGGPLLNEDGQVIGVISYAMSGRRSRAQLLENVATSTDPRPALVLKSLQKSPMGIGRFRSDTFFERNPHAMAAKAASLLTEFGNRRDRAMIGGVDPFLRELDEAVSRQHSEARLHFLQGSVYQMLGEYSDASSAYEEALRQSSDHFPAAYSLAYCQLALRSYESAAELFDFIARFKPYENLALYGLAQAEMQMLRYDRAIEHLRQVIRDHPTFVSGLYMLGRAYIGAGEDELATQILVKLKKENVNWAKLLERSRTSGPFSPVRLFEMPAAEIKSVSNTP
jgi:S1-C subfamily serine protease